jgi:hypothetical protein
MANGVELLGETVELLIAGPVGTAAFTLQATLVELDADICHLTVEWPVDGSARSFNEGDFYECLRSFRRTIEPGGYRVLCQGARPSVFPSGMSRDGGGMKAYALTLGQPALQKDLVSVFDPVDDVASVATVGEQDEFLRRHWELIALRANR